MKTISESRPIRELPAGSVSQPEWVRRFFGPDPLWLSASFLAHPEMDSRDFEAHVTAAYRSIFERLEANPGARPIRFWAFIPGIHDDLGGGVDRYKAFNAGRFAAYLSHLGRVNLANGTMPTASATGTQGPQFVLQCLASEIVGTAIENPRQVPAYRYSKRYGSVAPSFTRGTLLSTSRGPLLLVAGTASIVGEDSTHTDDFHPQAMETLANLTSLVAAAEGRELPAMFDAAIMKSTLAKFDEIRIYHPRQADRLAIIGVAAANFPPTCRVEILPASLCRQELLIEIEGIALPEPRRTV